MGKKYSQNFRSRDTPLATVYTYTERPHGGEADACSLNDPESGRNGFEFVFITMYWLSSLPLDGVDPSPEATWIQLQNATQRNQYSENCEFRLPQMKVGTLDSLLNLSDDLAKVNAAVESTVNKLRRQLYDVAEDDEDIVEITVEGVRPEVRCRRRWWWWWMCSHVLSHSLTHSLTLSLASFPGVPAQLDVRDLDATTARLAASFLKPLFSPPP